MSAAHGDHTDTTATRYEWERVVRRIVMPAPTKLAALTLSTYANLDGTRVRPGAKVLAAISGGSEKTAYRHLGVIRDQLGLLELVRRGGGRGGSGTGSEYRLAVPADLVDRAELLPPTPPPRRPKTAVDAPVPETAAKRWDWERLVRRILMPKAIKLAALVLATFADNDGSRVYPGLDELAATIGQTTRSAGRHIGALTDEYGLLVQVARGGGRGRDRTNNEYRLTIPVDLLDRVELLEDAARPHLKVVSFAPRTPDQPVDNPDSADIQMSGQCGQLPVDNSADDELTGHLDVQSIPDENEFHRTFSTPESQLTGHLDVPLPDHNKHQPSTPDPAQPPTAREPNHRKPLSGQARASPRTTRRRRRRRPPQPGRDPPERTDPCDTRPPRQDHDHHRAMREKRPARRPVRLRQAPRWPDARRGSRRRPSARTVDHRGIHRHLLPTDLRYRRRRPDPRRRRRRVGVLHVSRFTSEYGQRLNAARTAADMTQTEFGNAVNLTRSSIANIEGGRQAPSAEQVIQHAQALGIDPHWLLTGRGPDQAAQLAAGPGLARQLAKRLPEVTADLRRIADSLDALAEGAKP